MSEHTNGRDSEVIGVVDEQEMLAAVREKLLRLAAEREPEAPPSREPAPELAPPAVPSAWIEQQLANEQAAYAQAQEQLRQLERALADTRAGALRIEGAISLLQAQKAYLQQQTPPT